VAIRPGATELTVIASLASSLASVFR
jgi:hypothetical protein